MARPLRVEYAGAVYHVTCRGNARDKVFLVDPDRKLFLDVLADVVKRFNGRWGQVLQSRTDHARLTAWHAH